MSPIIALLLKEVALPVLVVELKKQFDDLADDDQEYLRTIFEVGRRVTRAKQRKARKKRQ